MEGGGKERKIEGTALHICEGEVGGRGESGRRSPAYGWHGSGLARAIPTASGREGRVAHGSLAAVAPVEPIETEAARTDAEDDDDDENDPAGANARRGGGGVGDDALGEGPRMADPDAGARGGTVCAAVDPKIVAPTTGAIRHAVAAGTVNATFGVRSAVREEPVLTCSGQRSAGGAGDAVHGNILIVTEPAGGILCALIASGVGVAVGRELALADIADPVRAGAVGRAGRSPVHALAEGGAVATVRGQETLPARGLCLAFRALLLVEGPFEAVAEPGALRRARKAAFRHVGVRRGAEAPAAVDVGSAVVASATGEAAVDAGLGAPDGARFISGLTLAREASMLGCTPAALRLLLNARVTSGLEHARIDRVHPHLIRNGLMKKIIPTEHENEIEGEFGGGEAELRRMVGSEGLTRVPCAVVLVVIINIEVAHRASPDQHHIANVEAKMAKAQRNIVGAVGVFDPGGPGGGGHVEGPDIHGAGSHANLTTVHGHVKIERIRHEFAIRDNHGVENTCWGRDGSLNLHPAVTFGIIDVHIVQETICSSPTEEDNLLLTAVIVSSVAVTRGHERSPSDLEPLVSDKVKIPEIAENASKRLTTKAVHLRVFQHIASVPAAWGRNAAAWLRLNFGPVVIRNIKEPDIIQINKRTILCGTKATKENAKCVILDFPRMAVPCRGIRAHKLNFSPKVWKILFQILRAHNEHKDSEKRENNLVHLFFFQPGLRNSSHSGE